MESATIFYILGGALVVIALVTSFLGVRSESFPGSPRAVGAMLAAVSVVVVATAVFAARNGAEELAHKEAELAAETEEAESAREDVEEDDEVPVDADGASLFIDEGCGQCHSLSDAGATAQVGPSLDDALQDETEEFVRTAIVDPNDYIEPGFSADVMPGNYGSELSEEELDVLVAYLVEVGGADG